MERQKVADMTTQIMAKFFHNTIFSMYSYVGQIKKNVFSVLNSCSLLFGRLFWHIIIIHIYNYKINIFYILATIRSIAKHRNCTDLEIVGPL